MPPTILIDLLKKVTGELAFDTSSADVRCSVFKCLPMILDNKLSHPLLEQLLPALRYSLHDNSESEGGVCGHAVEDQSCEGC